MSRLNPIAFPIAQSVRDGYNSPENGSLFNVDRLGLIGNYLVLWLFPEDYRPTMLQKDIQRGIDRTYVFPSSEPYQFEATVRDSRRAAIDVLQSLSDAGTVELFDFHVSDGATPYTIREGILSIEGTGSFYSDYYQGNLNQGFRFTFEEL